ncbi:hypothetical protein AMATHDRAFT_44835 [Amanita thiersii Skay4041]|uniref:DAGKc domain-containing protein n=1 Tax=Amanita thiersii Skay4041 TaxID=703135 RepID=A0A2A9NXS3_9AGAR|nr:hypothetical protein AMATHDRAFT_44835 [Amanita thiersii Skay4041]
MTTRELAVQLTSGQRVVFELTDTVLTWHVSGRENDVVVPYHQVINASFETTHKLLEVAYLARKDTERFYLFRYKGTVNDVAEDSVLKWVNCLMHSAYEGSGVKRSRRLRVLVNPYGGIGKSPLIFTKKIEPIFRVAGCQLNVTYTKHNGHAHEIAKDIHVDDYDVLVTVSGDGLIHEVMNGFANHADPQKAFSLPIAPIPTGSGNGLSVNLLGRRDGFDVVAAALNVIKGSPMHVDVFSVTQQNKRTISFMSQALGLMADLDLGTENLRWMGDGRFVVGLFRGLMRFKPCPIQLSYKVAETDKAKMIQAAKTHRTNLRNCLTPTATAWHDVSEGLPSLKYVSDEGEDWVTIQEPLLYAYAGKGPFVGRDLMAFPASLPDDGLVDITLFPLTKRADFLQCMPGAAAGEGFWHPKVRYVKAHAYRVRPLTSNGNLSIDGEAMPFEEFQVEVHTKLATLLSLHGHYVADLPEPPTNGVQSQ